MKFPVRPVLLGVLALGFSMLVLSRAQAGSDHFHAPVTDALVKEECGSCHLAFPPSMLPASSWRRMMNELDQHFGDNAALDPAVAAKITAYLTTNAGDAGGRRYSAKWLRGVDLASAPQRITELPKWQREHREISAADWRQQDVRSKANCTACHTDAERGYYEE